MLRALVRVRAASRRSIAESVWIASQSCGKPAQGRFIWPFGARREIVGRKAKTATGVPCAASRASAVAGLLAR
jgi:hypothetical protein